MGAAAIPAATAVTAMEAAPIVAQTVPAALEAAQFAAPVIEASQAAVPAAVTPGLGETLAALNTTAPASSMMAFNDAVTAPWLSGVGGQGAAIGKTAGEASMIGAPGIQGAAAPSAMSAPLYSPAGTPMSGVNVGEMVQQSAPTVTKDVPKGIGQAMSEYVNNIGNKVLDALPSAAVSMAGTGIQQMALAQAEEDRRRAEEEAQAKLAAEQEQMAKEVTRWGEANLSPASIAANREAEETDISNRLKNLISENLGVEAIGKMPSDYYKELADRTAAVAEASRDYANLTSKMMSHGNNRADINTLIMNRNLSGLAGDNYAILSQAQRKMSNVSPSPAAIMIGAGLQGLGQGITKL